MKLTSFFVHSFVGFSLFLVTCVTEVTAQRRPTKLPTAQPTRLPTNRPTRRPTKEPTPPPTKTPTPPPTKKPTRSPTDKPTRSPTKKPTRRPTKLPKSKNPNQTPTISPSSPPSALPSAKPTAQPSPSPTTKPSQAPSASPSAKPTAPPSPSPTAEPTQPPSASPSAKPTVPPTAEPTQPPTASPSAKPTAPPTPSPTAEPTAEPTPMPTAKPTLQPSPSPTTKPSPSPTAKPSPSPTAKPSPLPTAKPSTRPTALPTANPTSNPTGAPTAIPSVCKLDQSARPSFAFDVCDSSCNQVGSICYSKCPSDYYRNPDDGSQCIHNPIVGCPDNDHTYGHVLLSNENFASRDNNVCIFHGEYYCDGYPWEFGNPAFDYTNAQIRCENDHPHGCEMWGLISYPKVAPGYENLACCKCSIIYEYDGSLCSIYGLLKNGPYLDNDQVTCIIPDNTTTSSGLPPTQCNSNRQQIGNLCYKYCPPGYMADSTNCLSAPPLGWVKCGQFAAMDSSTCISFDQSKAYPACNSLNLPPALIGSQRYTMLNHSQVSVNGVVGSLTLPGLVTCGFLGGSSSLKIFANLVSGIYYEAVIQDDANFVVYKHDVGLFGVGISLIIFSTFTLRNVDANAYIGIFPDFPAKSGILANFDTSNGGQTIWTSMSHAINLGNSATVGLSMQQDGNLVQYAFYPDGSCDTIWASGVNLSPNGEVVWPHFVGGN